MANYKVFCVADKKYEDCALIALKSYFEHNTHPVTLYAFDDLDKTRFSGLKGLTIEPIKTFEIPKYESFRDYWATIDKISAKIGIFDSLIGEYEYACCFDLDSIFCGNVDELFVPQKYDLMGVEEYWGNTATFRGYPYFNAGFLIYKLNQPLFEHYLEFLKNWWICFPEQDFLSTFIKSRGSLPIKYNFLPSHHPLSDDIRFIHYAMPYKPFRCVPVWLQTFLNKIQPILFSMDVYWNYVKKNKIDLTGDFYKNCEMANKNLQIIRLIQQRKQNEQSNI